MEPISLATALDLDKVTHHLKSIRQSRFFNHKALLAIHRAAIDECIEKTLLPYEIKEALKSFYRTERLTEWLFYAEHIDMLLEQYGVNVFYWSSDDSIRIYSDMYLRYEMGLIDDRNDSPFSLCLPRKEEQMVIPTIVITQHF